MSLQQFVSTEFHKRFGEYPRYMVRAPGRVNLIGEHTDYNEGFVLPMAIDRAIWIALRPREDRMVSVQSLDFPNPAEFSLDEITHGEGWEEYAIGIAWSLQNAGLPNQGWEGVLAGDIPVGAGLSSSAALELAIARAFWAVSPWNWNGVRMAKLAKQTENEWLGLQSGIMDQMISALGKDGHALLIDCRSLAFQVVPLPKGTAVVVLDTATRRGLVDSAYNQRVVQCRAAARFFGVTALRDVTLETFEAQAAGLDDLTRRRARHVISENERTLQAAEVMQSGDAAALGKLMTASHESLRDDYQVSSTELDVMVEVACQQPGCFGARMTGAGFGGCAVALVEAESAPTFADAVSTAYQAAAEINPNVYICQATNGAEMVAG